MSETTKFKTQLEVIGSEEVKFDGNETWHKHESYLHDPERAYPSFNEVYKRDKLEAGFYDIKVELFVLKGKMNTRLTYEPAPENTGFNAPPKPDAKPDAKKAA